MNTAKSEIGSKDHLHTWLDLVAQFINVTSGVVGVNQAKVAIELMSFEVTVACQAGGVSSDVHGRTD